MALIAGREYDPKEVNGARASVAVTAVHGGSDQTLARAGRAIYVGGAGNLVCTLADGDSTTTFTGLLAGQVYPLAISAITATNTTITNAVILY